MSACLSEKISEENDPINIKIDRIMSWIGIPRRLKGYSYLVLAVSIVYKNPSAINNVTTGLYREVAERYGTTVSRVERNMRTALKYGVSDGKLVLMNGYPADHPQSERIMTAQKFIAAFADKLRHNLIGESGTDTEVIA